MDSTSHNNVLNFRLKTEGFKIKLTCELICIYNINNVNCKNTQTATFKHSKILLE